MKKILISVIAVCCTFLNVFSVSAANEEVAPYTVYFTCPECGVGDAYATTTRTYKGIYTLPCEHYSTGVDYYKAYNVVYKEICNRCGCYYSESHEELVYDHCGH